jgi:DHA1 family bicyclomycin/chloramphenicol resistance-like MFS transporter
MSPARPNNFFLILILGALSTLSPFAIDMYLPSFPQIAVDLHTTVARVSLSLSSYFVGYSFGQILYGPLLDRVGRKKPLYTGLGLFIAASLGCLHSDTVEWLTAFRLLQALGGAAALVAATAMVRDFFPVRESAKVYSLLILVVGASPLCAPSIGSFITLHFGWHWVFIALLVFAVVMLVVTFLFLPEAHVPDASISLRPLDIAKGFGSIIRQPQFYTYAFSGAFSFAGLVVYVTGSPIIFLHQFHVSPQIYGRIFALLSVGFIGSNQLNIALLRTCKSSQIIHTALIIQVIAAASFLATVLHGGISLCATLAFFFVLLSCMGVIYPNATALALAPFSKNTGSASALAGFLQIGIAALASSCIGFFDAQDSLPIVSILLTTACVGLCILLAGKRRITDPADSNGIAAISH